MDFKYKIGDKVRILDGSNIKNLVGEYVPSMKVYVGAVKVITDVVLAYEYPAYRFGNTPFIWDERMLCPIGETCNPPRIEKNGIATIVFWNDGTKTVVKRGADEPDSDYAAFTAALAIKTFGSNSAVKRIVAGTKEQEPKKKRKTEVKE